MLEALRYAFICVKIIVLRKFLSELVTKYGLVVYRKLAPTFCPLRLVPRNLVPPHFVLGKMPPHSFHPHQYFLPQFLSPKVRSELPKFIVHVSVRLPITSATQRIFFKKLFARFLVCGNAAVNVKSKRAQNPG